MSDTIIAAIISGVVSLIVSLITSYTVCFKINKNQSLKQKAGDNSNQVQIGEINGK